MKLNRGKTLWRVTLGTLALSSIPIFLAYRPAPGKPRDPGNESAWKVEGEIVLDLKDSASLQDLRSMAATLGLEFRGNTDESNPARLFRIAVSPTLLPSMLTRLRSSRLVEAAEPEHLFKIPEGESAIAPKPRAASSESEGGARKPNDPRYNEQWNLQRIQVERAWEKTKGKGVVVAVIDTGVAFDYGAGSGKLARDFGDTQFVKPYNFVDKNRTPWDDNGHGTHVAGTIAESTNNKEGVAGIAFEAKIMPLKVLSASGSGRMSDVAAAIRYAADNGANVINMSLGAPFPDSITANACKYARSKGVTIVCAAGNSGQEGVGYPAAFAECIAVSALGPTGELTPYSSWGSQVAISAPGGDRTKGDAALILQNTILDGEDDYFGFQGTSMASPHVAGVAALVVAQGVKDPEEVKAVLAKSAEPRGAREKYGAGELNASRAVNGAPAARTVYINRYWIIGFAWLACFALGSLLKWKGVRPNYSPAIAVTLGMLLPDVVSAFVDFGSLWNVLGHSVLVPAFFLFAESRNSADKRFYGFFAGATALHLGLDLLYGTSPFIGGSTTAAVPWLITNIVIGIGVFAASLRD